MVSFDSFPAPFRYQPRAGQPVEGPAFSLAFRLLAMALLGGAAVWAFLLHRQGLLGDSGGKGDFWMIAAWALMGITVYYILRSRTTLSATHVRQSWIWDKEMPVEELASARMIRVPGLDWLVAPRFYLRSLTGKFAVFYVADAELLAEFIRLRDELNAFRAAR